MKTTMLYSLLFLTLLGVGIGCKKEVEPGITPTEPPLPPEGCQIVRTISKNLITGIPKNMILAPEIITLDDGRKVEVSQVGDARYQYDTQGRIVEVKTQGLLGNYYLYRYSYGTQLITYNESFAASVIPPMLSIKRDTSGLLDNGFQTYLSNEGNPTFTYNADGQLLTTDKTRPPTSNKYENGNLTEQIYNASWIQEGGQLVPVDYQLRRFKYNTNRPNIPVVLQFTGKGSRNLPIKETWEMKRSSQFPDGPVYQKTFTYTYDKSGLVRRRITHGTQLYAGWFIEDDTYGVGVTDYEYKCP
jgi:hypothetical protein